MMELLGITYSPLRVSLKIFSAYSNFGKSSPVGTLPSSTESNSFCSLS